MKMRPQLKNIKELLFITWRDAFKSLIVLFIATGMCIYLSTFVDDNNPFAPMVYVLAISLISRITDGFLCGVISAIIGVICVNYIFTYPFYEFNMTLTGYPLTFSVMLIVSLIISTLTTMIKWQEQLFREAETEKARANLLRSVSHDIRTPLTSIMGSTSVLRDNWTEISPEDRHELLCEIYDDSQWLIRITENILSVTKFGGDKARIIKDIEAVEEIIGEVLLKFKKLHPNIAVNIDIPNSVLLVPMDAVLIEQVIINLLENSVRHGEGTTALSIKVETDQQNAVFTISDDGGGFSEHLLSNLFVNHIQHANNEKHFAPDMRRDMGIGLSVCMTIIKAHGGTITAGNNDSGAVITFTLPLGGDAS